MDLQRIFGPTNISSWASHISCNETKLQREIVLDWFGEKSDFIKSHQKELKTGDKQWMKLTFDEI